MMTDEAILDAFINANLLFFIGYALWWSVRRAMQALGLQDAFETQIRLLNALFLAIICAPLIAMVFGSMQNSGLAAGVNINLSDAVVAYYLNGGFQMESSRFEALVLLRDTFVLNLLNAEGFVAQAAIVIFLSGLAVGLSRLILSVYCLKRIVGRSYSWRKIGPVQIKLSDRTLVPFSTRGWRTHYVIIPSHMLAHNIELKVALAHEFQHIRQGDLLWEIALEALKPFFFLNPAYHAWKREVEHLRELHCDTEVLSRSRINVRDYCETLLSVCQKSLRRDRAFVLAVPKVTLVTADRSTVLVRKQSLLERRIRAALARRNSRYRRTHFTCMVVPLLTAVTVSTVAIQSPGDWSQDRLMLSTVVNLDRLDEINRRSTFGRVRN